jgi:AAA+ superfamily predicted ATPase
MHQEHRATLVTLLTELQDLQENPNIFVFAATNDIDVLDAALKDRFAGSICEIKKLNKKNRAKLIQNTFAEHNYEIESLLAWRLAEVMEFFGNREIQFVVMTSLLKQAVDKKNNPEVSHHLCHYIRKAIKDSGKHGEFRLEVFSTYSDGI